MKTSLLSIFTALLLLFVAGCQHGPRVQKTGSPGEVFAEGRLDKGILIDGTFNADGTLDRSPFIGYEFPKSSLRLTDIRSAASDSGFNEVQVTVENTSRERQRIEYRYRWFDERGLEIAIGTSGWRSETLEGKEPRVLVGVGRETGVKSFQLIVRTYQPRK